MQTARKAVQTQHQFPRPPGATKKTSAYRGRERSPFVFFLLISVGLALIIAINVSQHALIAQKALQTERLSRILQTEEARRERLLVEWMRLKSPENIERIARERLGMVMPVQITYINLPAETVTAKRESVTLWSKAYTTSRSGLSAIHSLTGKVSTKLANISTYLRTQTD